MRLARGVVAFAFVLLTACGASDEAETPTLTEGAVHVTSRDQVPVTVSTPAPIKLGKNDLAIDFPSTNVTLVEVSALMPAHGHGTKPPAITQSGATYHVDDLVLYMRGRWEVRFTMRHDDHDDEALVTIDVP